MLLDSIITLTTIVTISTYIWSVKAHFRSEKMPDGAKLISLLVILSAILTLVLTWMLHQPAYAQLAGLALHLMAYGLFWRTIAETRAAALLAAFDARNPGTLVITGPYRFVRHPFYTSYLLFWLGCSVAIWSLWGIVPLVGMAVTYWRAAVDEEAKFSRTAMAERYSHYMQKTSRFIPGIW